MCVLHRLSAIQTTCLVKYGNKKTLKKHRKRTQAHKKRQYKKKKNKKITGKRILVKLPCSFQEPWNVIVRFFEQLN